jgi:hypothetical protein
VREGEKIRPEPKDLAVCILRDRCFSLSSSLLFKLRFVDTAVTLS